MRQYGYAANCLCFEQLEAAACSGVPRCTLLLRQELLHMVQQVISHGMRAQVTAIAYDNPIPGFATANTINLRLWAAKPGQEFDLEAFNTGDYVQAGFCRVFKTDLSCGDTRLRQTALHLAAPARSHGMQASSMLQISMPQGVGCG